MLLKKLYTSILLVLVLSIGCYAAASLGDRAPDFTLTDIKGKKHSLKDFRGKIVLLDVWASWCRPCRHYMPKNQKLHDKYSSRGLEVLAVNIEGIKSSAPAYIKSNSFTFKVLYSKGNWKSEVVKKYGVRGIPFVALIDRQGYIRFTGHPSGITDEMIENALANKFPSIKITKIINLIGYFEKYVKWSAQNGQWKKKGRKVWKSLAVKAYAISDVKKVLLLLFESFNSDAFIPAFSDKRSSWKEKVGSAENLGEIKSLVKELALGIKEEYLSSSWNNRLKSIWVSLINKS